MSQVNIIQIPIAKISSFERNSKKHPPRQIELLTKSIREFGFLSPCIVRTIECGKYELAAGHARVAAAARAKLKTVPCIVADHLTKKQFSAYVIADNKLAELAEWDYEILKSELQELELDGFDLDALGFDEAEALKLLRGVASDGDDERGDDGDSGASGQGDGENDGSSIRTSIAYNIIFDTDEQQQAWFGLLRYLKAHVEGDSIGARLRAFIEEGGYCDE